MATINKTGNGKLEAKFMKPDNSGTYIENLGYVNYDAWDVIPASANNQTTWNFIKGVASLVDSSLVSNVIKYEFELSD